MGIEVHIHTVHGETYMHAWIPNGDPERVAHFKADALAQPFTEYVWVGRPGWWEPRTFK